MRVAVLADIHGNVLALDAVLADVERQSVDAVVVLGDLADRGPFPHKVIERVQAAAHVVLLGNTDEMFLQMDRRDVPEAWVEAEQYAPVRWTYARLTQADLA
ncbi:MAG TPA: metallophosphoesterase, partial [Aggregatilineales bacterium]|nr:metallophosphoesterase [Aggregatilineales bacterium]